MLRSSQIKLEKSNVNFSVINHVVISPSKSRFWSIVFLVWDLSSSHMVHLKVYMFIQFIINKWWWCDNFLTANMSLLALKSQLDRFVCFLFVYCLFRNFWCEGDNPLTSDELVDIFSASHSLTSISLQRQDLLTTDILLTIIKANLSAFKMLSIHVSWCKNVNLALIRLYLSENNITNIVVIG